MVKLTDEHKQDNSFREGVYPVKINSVKHDETEDGKEFIEFGVINEAGAEGTARVWFTTDKAIRYSFSIIKGIFTHNAPEGKEDEIRQNVENLEDTDQLAKACEQLVGRNAFYQVEKTDRTYESNGEIRHSYNRNIYGYEPAPKKATVESEPQIEDTNIRVGEDGPKEEAKPAKKKTALKSKGNAGTMDGPENPETGEKMFNF